MEFKLSVGLLWEARHSQGRIFCSLSIFMRPDSCVRALLPPPRDPIPVSRLRYARRFQAASNRTKEYQSFLDCGLLHYQ